MALGALPAMGCLLSRALWWSGIELAGASELVGDTRLFGAWWPSPTPPPSNWFVSHDGELLAFVHPLQPDREVVRVLYRHRVRSPQWREKAV